MVASSSLQHRKACSAMACYAMLWHAMLCYGMLCYAEVTGLGHPPYMFWVKGWVKQHCKILRRMLLCRCLDAKWVSKVQGGMLALHA